MKVSLVFPREHDAIKTGGGDYPLGILYIATYAMERGIDCKVHDLTFSTWDELKSELQSRQPDIVAFSIFTPIADSGLKAIKLARRILPESTIIVGGVHATIDWPNLIRNPNIDIVVLGEGERVFVELIEALKSGTGLRNIQGIVYKHEGKIIENLPNLPINDLDELPFPNRDLLDIEKYIRLNHIFSLITSRGCPFRCFYCQPTQEKVFGKKTRRRSPENVLEEIEWLIHNYRHRFEYFEFYFVDDTFTYDKRWLARFSFLLRKKNLQIKWRCLTRVDMIDEDIVKMLKEAGCVGVHFGVESGSQRILSDVMRKGITISDIKKAFRLTHKYGLFNTAYIMIGTPTETKEDLEKTVKLVREIHPDGIQISITTPMLGSNLYYECVKDGTINIKSFSEYDYCKNEYPIILRNLRKEDLAYYQSKILIAWKVASFKNLLKYLKLLITSKNRRIFILDLAKKALRELKS